MARCKSMKHEFKSEDKEEEWFQMCPRHKLTRATFRCDHSYCKRIGCCDCIEHCKGTKCVFWICYRCRYSCVTCGISLALCSKCISCPLGCEDPHCNRHCTYEMPIESSPPPSPILSGAESTTVPVHRSALVSAATPPLK